MPIDYFDWSETRVVFISTSLGQYQKSAISISRPFDLYQITLYEDNIINLEKIVNEFSEDINFESKEVKTKEVKVYTVEDQLGGVSQDLKDLYDQIKEYALSLDSEIIVKPTKLYIAFKINLKRNFFSISFKKNQIEIDLNIRKNELNDAFKLAYDISNRQYSKTHWAIDVDSSTDFEKIEFYLKQAYTLNK
jgi:predicted transport protein